MISDALWLLKRQSFLIAREQVLMHLIKTADNSVPDDKEIIEEVTFARPTGESVQMTPSQSSKTEYIALNLELLRSGEVDVQERKAENWHKELKLIRNWLSILEAALLVLTPEEQALVNRHFKEGKSLEMLSQSPLLDTVRSHSTLKRMLKTIIKKVNEVISEEESHHILPRV